MRIPEAFLRQYRKYRNNIFENHVIIKWNRKNSSTTQVWFVLFGEYKV